MSQIVTRKGPVGEDKEKGQTSDTPVKEMKKKMAANAEKEKQAAEKHAEKDKEKEKEKSAETKQSEKAEKNVEKNSEKKEKPEKASEKKEKQAEKEKVDKSVDKNADKKTEAPAEKAKEDKNAKPERADDKVTRESKERETPKPKVNGARTNGQRANANANGDAGDSDGTVSSDEELVIIDHERDDMFPELAYDDSDGEFEPPTPEGLPSRSYTRRSQSKESKVLKLKEDTPVTDRKLRSSDSPKPETRKTEKTEKTEKKDKEADSAGKKDLEVAEGRDEHGKDKSATELGGDVDMDEGAEGAEGAERAARGSKDKDGTNYSRSRVKVSPYRRLADQTVSSVTANYTGNNTTMEMDLSEASLAEEAAPADGSPYLSGLRAIRGRRSYKPLKEMALRNVGVSRSVRSATGVGGSEQPSRPTAPVVGRKRKPEGDDYAEPAEEAREEGEARDGGRGKRARLLDRLVRPFRGAASTPLPPRRNAEIVGINTDLPLTAPVASPDTFDPETLKAATVPPPAAPPAPSAPAPVGLRDRDSKRCTVM